MVTFAIKQKALFKIKITFQALCMLDFIMQVINFIVRNKLNFLMKVISLFDTLNFLQFKINLLQQNYIRFK